MGEKEGKAHSNIYLNSFLGAERILEMCVFMSVRFEWSLSFRAFFIIIFKKLISKFTSIKWDNAIKLLTVSCHATLPFSYITNCFKARIDHIRLFCLSKSIDERFVLFSSYLRVQSSYCQGRVRSRHSCEVLGDCKIDYWKCSLVFISKS